MPEEKKQQRDLTPSELETAATFTKKWTPDQLRLIWKKKMPPQASLEDFQLFLYAVDARDLDPLLSEVYCRLQWDKDSGEMKLLLLDGIHGLLKSADKTGQFNGIATTFQEDDNGRPLSATTTIRRKGCDYPFVATVYWSEFVGKKFDGGPSFMWASKPHVMLGKCAQASCLRLAFPAALAGVYVAEELEHNDNPPADVEDFEVTEIVEPDNIFDAIVQDLAAPEPEPLPRLDPDIEIVKEAPPAPPPVMPPDDKELKEQAKSRNKALTQRLMLDLDIAKELRVPLLTDYYRGYLGLINGDELPKDPTLYTKPLERLDFFATHNPGTGRTRFVTQPRQLGEFLSNENNA